MLCFLLHRCEMPFKKMIHPTVPDSSLCRGGAVLTPCEPPCSSLLLLPPLKGGGKTSAESFSYHKRAEPVCSSQLQDSCGLCMHSTVTYEYRSTERPLCASSSPGQAA